MQLENHDIETILRQTAAWEEFERKKEALRDRLRTQAAPALSWWQRLRGRPLLNRPPVWSPVHARTEAAQPWKETVAAEDSQGLSMDLEEAPSGDVHLHLRAVGEQWAEAEVLRIEYRTTPEAEPERGVTCLRGSERQGAFVADVNLGRVGRGVGVEVYPAMWAEVTEEEAAWAVRRTARPPTLQAWQEGWAKHRSDEKEETGQE
jgi:hypothetical protein